MFAIGWKKSEKITQNMREKILFILPRFPYPLIKGDSIRAYYLLREFARHYDVYVFAVTDTEVLAEDLAAIQPFTQEICLHRHSKLGIFWRLLVNVGSSQPFQAAYFHSRAAQSKLNDFLAEIRPDHIFCQLVRTAKYVAHLPPERKILDYQDAFSVGLARRVKDSHFLLRPLLKMEYERMQAYEKAVFSQFAHRVIISEADRQLIPHPQKDEIYILPNGIDADFFEPQPQAKNIDLLFVGNMDYSPNVNCVLYVAKQVLPLLLPRFPKLKFYIVGANPLPKVKALENENIVVTGFVDDIRDYYARARIFLAPMQIGIGMQNKILQAMSMELPCITSSLSYLPIAGEKGKEILVGDTPETVAEAAAALLDDPEACRQIGENARKYICQQFAWSAQIDKFWAVMSRQT